MVRYLILTAVLCLPLAHTAAIAETDPNGSQTKLPANDSKAGFDVQTLKIGADIPDFNLPATDGKQYAPADFNEAAVLVIVFTANHCPTAQAYEQRINKFATEYKSKGVELVAISSNDPRAVRLDELGYTDVSDSLPEMKIRAGQEDFKFIYLYDGDEQAVAKVFGPVATPHAFVFDQQRKLRYQGAFDDSEKAAGVKKRYVRDAVEAILADQKVPVEISKPFGCSIKWAYKRDQVRQSLEKLAGEKVTMEPIDAEGLKQVLANDSGKLRLVNVWASYCPPCVAEFPHLVIMHMIYRGRDFELVTVNMDLPGNRDRALDFLKRNYASCTNYALNGGVELRQVMGNYSGAIPYTLLIAPGGKVLFDQTGMIEPLDMRGRIVDYLGRTYHH